MELITGALSIVIGILTLYSLYDIWIKRDYDFFVKLLATAGMLFFPMIGIIVYWVVVRRESPTRGIVKNFAGARGEARVIPSGRGGHRVDDVSAAIRDARGNADTIYEYFYAEGDTFREFYNLPEKYKKEALEPYVKLLDLTDMEYIRYNSDASDGEDEHYDYYVGQINEAGERHGLGMYSFEWAVCIDGEEEYAAMKYLICEWRNDRQVSNGYVYCFSNAEPHTWMMSPGHYKLTSEKGYERL